MDHPFCFQRPYQSMNHSVETVVVNFEFSPTHSSNWRLSDEFAMCAANSLQMTTARLEMDQPHLALARKSLRSDLMRQA